MYFSDAFGCKSSYPYICIKLGTYVYQFVTHRSTLNSAVAKKGKKKLLTAEMLICCVACVHARMQNLLPKHIGKTTRTVHTRVIYYDKQIYFFLEKFIFTREDHRSIRARI